MRIFLSIIAVVKDMYIIIVITDNVDTRDTNLCVID